MGNPADPVPGLSPLKRALIALDDMQSRLDAAERSKRDPIAIVGMGCRFPGGVTDADSFWRVLRDGVDTVRDVPRARWDAEAYYDPDPNAVGKSYVRRGAFLDEFDRFDPQFFGIAPREAAGMDPQQRLLLEVTWEALEHAAISPDNLSGTATGVFVGINSMDYAALQLQRGDIGKIDAYSLSGTAHSIAAGRLAYVLGLQGPTLAVDTACSSSLVAIHLACQSLRNDECRTAIAGGVQVTLSPLNSVVFSKLRMLAADGRCKTFDARGDGFVEGEGCAIIVLKRLSHALADGDSVLAVIRASAVNQDGASTGLTAPNGPAQEAVIRAALDRGGIVPADVDYVEAHGTGTALGDPIEVQALAAVLGEHRPPERPLLIGSVKTNLGHTQAAAGVAGLVKLALALDREEIPPSLHFEQPNPHIPWSGVPVKVVTRATPWPRGRSRRIGGVSAFGFSGTNVHVVLEEAPSVDSPPPQADRPVHVLALSARSEGALRTLASRWAARLQTMPDARIADIAFTANVGRAHLPERVALPVSSREDALAQLAAVAAGAPIRGARGRAPADRPKVAFLCTGQGAQYAGMGRELYDTQPVFRKALDTCAELLRDELDQPLLSVLHLPAGTSPIDRTAYAQPALFAIEYALAELWRSWGVVPSGVLGHSVGEYVAACLAGVFPLEHAIKLVALRGRLMQSLPPGGGMAAVFATEERVRAAVAGHGDRIAIAAVNAPDNVVVSGPSEAIDELLSQLSASGVSSERLNVSHAFHSSLMDPVLDEFEAAVGRLSPGAPRIALISNLTGRLAGSEIRSASYWRRHLRETVLFGPGVRALSTLGFNVFVEIGPRPTLSSLAARSLPADAVLLPSLRKTGQDWARMGESVAELYVRGAGIDWAGVDRDRVRRKLAMPTYPFERERYWLPGLEAAAGTAASRRFQPDSAPHGLLGRRLSSALDEMQFESEVSVDDPAFLAARCEQAAVFPSGAYLEIGLAVARAALGEGSYVVNELSIAEPLTIGSEPVRLQTVLSADDSGSAAFRVFSLEAGTAGTRERWRLHTTGSLLPAPRAQAAASDTLDAIKARCAVAAPIDEHSAASAVVAGVWRGECESLGLVRLPDAVASDGAFQLHPAFLDAAMRVAAAALPPALLASGSEHYAHVSVGRCQVYVERAASAWSHVRVTSPAGPDTDGFIADVRFYGEDGTLIAEVDGVCSRPTSAAPSGAAVRKTPASWLYETVWKPEPRTIAEAGAAGTWIVLREANDAGARGVADRLVSRGVRVVSVARGDAFSESNGLVQVDPARPEHFVRLLEHAAAIGAPVAGIVDLWSAARTPTEWSATAPNALALDGCRALLYVVQALEAVPGAGRPRLAVATRGAAAVGSLPHSIAFWQRPAWALAQTIALEHRDLHCMCLDLDPESDNDPDLVATELFFPSAERQVAFRGRQRYVPRLVRSTAAQTLGAAAERVPAVVADASYLITGGVGALGMSVAAWMVSAGARHLVLASRRPPSPEVAAEIAALEQSGARITIVQADVSREPDVTALLAQIRAGLPPLRGIVHAAGVVDDGLLVQQTGARFETVFAPKASGAWHLHRQTDGLELDFFVLFSSMASLFGAPGQGSYASANAFVDALADHRRTRGLPALSIQWGPWAGRGMAGRVSTRDRQRWLDQGFGSILPADGVLVLEDLLRQASPATVAVLPIDWAKWVRQFPVGAQPPLVRELLAGSVQGDGARQPPRRRLLADAAAVAPNRRRGIVEAFVREAALEVLGLDRGTAVDPRQPLHELGLDSLMAVELRDGIAAALERALPATLLFKHPTLEALSTFVLSQVAGASVGDAAPADEAAEGDAGFATLSDEDARQLLVDELSSLSGSSWAIDET